MQYSKFRRDACESSLVSFTRWRYSSALVFAGTVLSGVCWLVRSRVLRLRVTCTFLAALGGPVGQLVRVHLHCETWQLTATKSGTNRLAQHDVGDARCENGHYSF